MPSSYNMTKQETYTQLLADLKTLISGEHDHISILANTTAAIREAFPFFWIGFYLVSEEPGYLHLGPFQGTTACFKIPYGRGVCGTAWKESKTQVVSDVEQFPGHIACSSLSRSEIVVPMFNHMGDVIGVLDIDSTDLNTFDDIDATNLEQLCKIVVDTLSEA